MWIPSFWPGVSGPEHECSVLSSLDDIFSWGLLNPSLGSLWGAISGCPTENPGGLLRLRAAARFGGPRRSGLRSRAAVCTMAPAACSLGAGCPKDSRTDSPETSRGGEGKMWRERVRGSVAGDGGGTRKAGTVLRGTRLRRRVFERPVAGGCTNGFQCR